MPDSATDDVRARTADRAPGAAGDVDLALAEAIAEVVKLRQALREVLDNANDIIYTHDLTGAFQSMNARGEQILGYTPEEIVEMNIADILPDAELAVAREQIRAKQAGGGATTYELNVIAKSGDRIPLEVSTRVIVRDGEPVGVQGIARDVRERKAAQEALAASERRFRGLIEHSGDVKMLLDPEGTMLYTSPAGERVLGVPAEGRVGQPVFDVIHPDDVQRARDALASLVEPSSEIQGEVRVVDRSGQIRWLAFTAHNALEEPAIGAIVVNYFDVTDRKRNEQRLADLASFQEALISLVEASLQEGLSEEFYNRVLHTAVEVIPGAQAGSLMVKDHADRCHFVAAVGFDLAELGQTFLYEHELKRDLRVPGPQVVTGFDPGHVEDESRDALLFGAGKAAQIAATLSIPIELDGQPGAYFHLDNFDDPGAFSDDAVGMARALSSHIATLLQRFRLEADLRQERAALDAMAYTDALTGLPNRNMFYRRAREQLGRGPASPVAVLFFDLDAFKQVNDTFGHPFGDQLLKAVAKRLLGCVRDGDTVSRWGGDEFVFLLPDAGGEAAVKALAARVIDRVNAPFAIEDQQISIGCSIGVALTTDGDMSIDVLTREADIALYRAKEEGRNRFRVFSDGMRTRMMGRMQLEHDLARAIRERAFGVATIPRVALPSGAEVARVVRLVWDHPEQGRLASEEFLPFADQDALAEPLFACLLQLACRHSAAARGVTVVVELWPALFRLEDVVATADAVVAEHGADPERIELAVSEATAMRGPDGTAATLQRLRERGFRLSIAGYGASVTSLEMLQQLPIDSLVIQRRLVDRLCDDDAAATRQVLQAIVAMAHALGMHAVADGIESQGHVDCITEFGFDRAQGAYFTEPAGEREPEPGLESRP